MNKILAVLGLMVLVLPLTVNLLLTGPDSLLALCMQFFGKLLGHVTRFGTG
ncbi:hypothetical protein NDK47_01125 [Brevibacillus ruminantium]|uniref:Uncharacterized protein n=1 Tax=Brevibacillus ruminantium TaxID=2950604 RepID=A0ABY4WFQ2_9BACL|nr:hypothetical protein [Brevibacillus ruminantium]USG65990.1 hypothetical protein NDK47_01125 [Brevibacillus ruminantium]